MLRLSIPSSSKIQGQNSRITRYNMDQDDILSSLKDYEEILQSEVYVDVDRLRILARHGVPQQIRGEVWKYLLGVERADRSKELSSIKERLEEYGQIDKTDPDVAKRIRGEVNRYQRKVKELEGKHFAEQFENVILAYLNTNRNVEYTPGLVALCAPFLYCLDKECDAYYCFERMMQAIEDFYTSQSIKEHVANFMSLFRQLIPDLYSYFEDEEVDLNEWVTSWLQNLLAKEMAFEDVLRLWDVYFAILDPLELHPFVCLAILRHVKEKLEDLEQSEIRTILLRLPRLNIRMIVAEAVNLRHETWERQISEDAEL